LKKTLYPNEYFGQWWIWRSVWSYSVDGVNHKGIRTSWRCLVQLFRDQSDTVLPSVPFMPICGAYAASYNLTAVLDRRLIHVWIKQLLFVVNNILSDTHKVKSSQVKTSDNRTSFTSRLNEYKIVKNLYTIK